MLEEAQYSTAEHARGLTDDLNANPDDDWTYRADPSSPNVRPTYGMFRVQTFDEENRFEGYL